MQNYHLLRQKYPTFSFDKFDYHQENNFLIINFYYSCSEFSFIHEIKINNIQVIDKNIDFLVFNIGMTLIPSYWKLFCSPTIQINTDSFQLTTDQLQFWQKLLIRGMSEYFYINQIDFTKKDFLKIILSQNAPDLRITPSLIKEGEGRVLVPIGGGKDSIVTLELLKPHYQVTAFAINPVPVIQETIKLAGVPAVFVDNIFDPQLFELNKLGYLNGHVPISAFYAFTSILSAHLLDIPYVALSNERSSNEGNTTYLGHEINHQYSKSLEFETDLNNYVSSPKYFSFLRPLYELQITKLFSNYPQYFKIFSSCNNNFKMQKTSNKLWCNECPKCVSTALMLSQFIGKDRVSQIMGAYPPDLSQNQKIIDELSGKSPVKPFECVLTRTEANACLTGQGLTEILNSWLDNPIMPVEFANILKSTNRTMSNTTNL